MNKRNPYILWLPGWYPNEDLPIVGDFIQRHAKAAATLDSIQVLFIYRSKKWYNKRLYSEKNKSLSEYTYGYSLGSGTSFIHRFLSAFLYFLTTLYALGHLFMEKGLPISIHVHVAKKNALVGLLLAKCFRLKLYYSEHSSFFLNESPDSIGGTYFKRKCWIYFLRRCTHIIAVSNHLAQSMKDLVPSVTKIEVIPNTIDEQLLQIDNHLVKNKHFTFVFIGSSSEEKNTEKVIDAFQRTLKQNPFASLIMIGDFNTKKIPSNLNIVFTGEIPHDAVVETLKRCHALILFSTYETFGCVVIEANACGLPVVVSDIPAMRELVSKNNGIIVPSTDHDNLMQALLDIQTTYEKYDKEKISYHAKEFYGMTHVGNMFHHLYNA